MTTKAAKTGPGPTLMVALEQHFPENKRLIQDNLAPRILPLGTRFSMWLKLRLMSVDRMVKWMEKRLPGMWSGFMCRKRYIDDKLKEAMGGRTKAVLNLGVGFDTRAYRLPALSKVPVWEIDQPQIIKAKRIRLKKILGEIPPYVTLVPIDFTHENLREVLASFGYRGDRNTFIVWEAVTQYLPESSIRKTFDFLSKLPAGSRLIFTYIRKDFLDGKVFYDHHYLYQNMVTKRQSWLFGLNPGDVEAFLSDYNWRLLEHLGYDELAERYVKPTGRNLLSTPLERIVYAEKI